LLIEIICNPCGNAPAPGRGGWMLSESRWSSVRAERAERVVGIVVERDVADRSLG